METIYLARRTSRHYVGTYSHLDSWEEVGTATLTPAREVDPGNGIDEAGTYVRWATVPVGQDVRATARALEDTLSRGGCHHEWDCCGCASYYTRVTHRHGRRLVLRTRVTRNY